MKSLVLLLTSAIAGASHPWSYQSHGDLGPSYWPGTCAQGLSQSPINLMAAVSEEQPDWKFSNYEVVPDKMVLVNNGHSAKVYTMGGENSPNVEGGGLPGNFRFAQLHFHWGNSSMTGSEHQIDGKIFPLEVHMVHYNTKYEDLWQAINQPDGLAVLSMLFNLSPDDNPSLEPVIKNLLKVQQSKMESQMKTSFAVKDLLPPDRSVFFRYTGSLTTPGCNEVVTWTVFHDVLAVSETQLSAFRGLVDSEGNGMGNNYRPVQPLNGRKISISGFDTVESSRQLVAPDKDSQNNSKEKYSPNSNKNTHKDDSNKDEDISTRHSNSNTNNSNRGHSIPSNTDSHSTISNEEKRSSGSANTNQKMHSVKSGGIYSKSPTGNDEYNILLSQFCVSFIVLLMPTGCALREASIRPVKSSGIMRLWTIFCICAFSYWALGFGFAAGDGQTSFSGSSYFFGRYISDSLTPAWFLHFLLSLSTVTLAFTSLADRTTQVAMVLHSVIITTIIQPIIAHWLWYPTGWLAMQGVIDAGGSGVIHLTAAVCVTTGYIVIGTHRMKSLHKLEAPAIPNLQWFLLGGILVICGITASNSSLQYNVPGIIMNTILSISCAGLCVLVLITVLKYFKMTQEDDYGVPVMHGSLAGAVGVSAGAALFSSGAAVCVGCMAGVWYLVGADLGRRLKIRDPLETVIIHGSGGLWGLLATPLFCPDGLLTSWTLQSAQHSLFGVGWALLAAITISLWASGCSFALFVVLRYAGQLPTTKEMLQANGTKDEMEKMNKLDEHNIDNIEDLQNKTCV